jgi:multidrug efflux pump subunit AcrB
MAHEEMENMRFPKTAKRGLFARLFGGSPQNVQMVPGIQDIESDLEDGKKEVHVTVNERVAAEAGLTAAQVAAGVRAAFDGAPAGVIRTLDEEIEIKVRFPEADRSRGIAALRDVRVPNRLGYLIPLTSLATFEESVGLTSIKHVDGDRTMTVTAQIDEDVTTAVGAMSALEPKIRQRLEKEFPNVRADFTGEAEDTNESFRRLGFAGLISLALIYLIVATVFNSLTRPILVIMAIPVAVCGVIYAFFFHGQPLGFMTMMGVIGLAGVVVNNQIVFVQFVNRMEEEGRSLADSIRDSARVRLRPMMLTSITTLFGLLPTAYGLGGSDPFVKPMALALGWGVAFSLVMTMVALPALIHCLGDIEWLITLVRDTLAPPVAGDAVPAEGAMARDSQEELDSEESAIRRVK